MTTNIGFVLFPRMTLLDLVGPYEVFTRFPDTEVHLIAATSTAVRADGGIAVLPSHTFDAAPALDVICVPGGNGVNPLLADDRVLRYVAEQGGRASYVTSVCTGALVLGAAGLLRGYRATTHWLSLDLLPLCGATPVRARVVVDRNRITGGGVTAGIDFALTLAANWHGEAKAREIQLTLEYDPQPPFDSGSVERAAPALVARIQTESRARQTERKQLLEAARKLARLDK